MIARRRTGFTLVELIVTSTVAAMLVTTIIGLTLRLERQRQSLQSKHQIRAQVGLLRETFQRDLRQSTDGVTLNFNPIQLILKGYLATDQTGAPTSGYATVIYTVDQDNLIRIEQRGSEQQFELMWSGVGAMNIHVAGMGKPDTESNVPERLRVVLVDLQGRQLMDLTTTIRSDLSVEARDE